jgi:hypothetical protein
MTKRQRRLQHDHKLTDDLCERSKIFTHARTSLGLNRNQPTSFGFSHAWVYKKPNEARPVFLLGCNSLSPQLRAHQRRDEFFFSTTRAELLRVNQIVKIPR